MYFLDENTYDNMSHFIQIFLCILYLSTVPDTYANPLQGGKSVVAVKENELPFVVSLAVSPATRPKDHFCGGTLISKKYILTAKHCFVNVRNQQPLRNITNIRVTIASIDMTSERKYGITSWKTYEEWAIENNIIVDNIYHDLAIATLTEDVNHIAPAAISQCNHKQVRGQDAMTAGWGVTDNGVEPKFLQKASLQVISRKKCRFNFINTDAPPFMLLNHLCTIHIPPVVLGCGDSGGPLLINGNELIGVNESVCANDIDHPNEQNSHQSVEYYRQFIEAFAENKAACPFKF